jgi:hypothetical protein
MTFHFDDPLVDAMMCTLYHSEWRTCDGFLIPMPTRDQLIPHSSYITVDAWLTKQRQHIGDDLGPDILGKIFLGTYAKGYENAFPYTLICDLDDPFDLSQICKRYGPDSCTVVTLNGAPPIPFQNLIGISASTPKEQVNDFLAALPTLSVA